MNPENDSDCGLYTPIRTAASMALNNYGVIMKFNFSEKAIKERAGEDFLDALHNDGCLDAYAASAMTPLALTALMERIEYIASRNTFEAAQERMEREAEYAFEECS